MLLTLLYFQEHGQPVVWVTFLSLLLHTGKCVNSGGHKSIFSCAQVIMAHFHRKKVSYKEEMCACLLSSLPLNKHDKREYFQQKRSRICHLKWWLGVHTNKGTLRSRVPPSVSELRFVNRVSIYCLCLAASAKENDKRYSMSSWFWVDSLITWTSRGQRRADEFRVRGQKAARKLLHWLKITWSGFYLAISCLDGLDENLLSCRGFNVRFRLNHCL